MTDGDTVLVFGGAGYIGSCLVPHLLNEGYYVRVFDNFMFGSAGLSHLNSDRLEIIEADICDTRAVAAATEGANAVILLAALVGHRVADSHWVDTRNTNFLASTVVLDAAVEHGAERFIFASTNSVYGIQAGVMYETSIPEPVSLYSRLKLRMEERVIRTKRTGFHPSALRLATCHGFSPRMRFDLVANTMIRDAVCQKEITVESGEQWRAQIHVDDAARSFLACLKAHPNLVSGEIFNVGASDQNIQINQLANLVKTLVPDTKINILEMEPDLVDYRLSCSKIEKILDFKPVWSLEQSMQHLRDLLNENRFDDPYSLKYLNT